MQPKVVPNELLFPRRDLLKDLVRHKRHRDPFGKMFFHAREELVGPLYCLPRQDVALILANLGMLIKVTPEVVPPGASSSLDNLVVARAVEFVIIKGDGIQGFDEPAVLAVELVCRWPGPQATLLALAAYQDVPIPTGERKVGRRSIALLFDGMKLIRQQIAWGRPLIAKLLLDGMKLFRQPGATHLFVKEIERA